MIYLNHKREIKEIKKMKKTYEITASVCGELSTLILVNPKNRNLLKEGFTEYSGAKVIKVKRIK